MSNKNTSVVLLGDWGVGKSSMLAAHMSGIPQVKAISSTIGMSFCMLEPKSPLMPSGIACWDTAGQERYRALIPMYTRDAGAFVCLVPSTTSRDLESARSAVVDSVASALKDGDCDGLIHIALVMSKCDIGGNIDDVLGPVKKSIDKILCDLRCNATVTCHKCSSLNPASCSAVFTVCTNAIKRSYNQHTSSIESIQKMKVSTSSELVVSSRSKSCC